jgi:hypothetical protein
MPSDSFFEEGSRLLTQSAFEFVLDGELKRAVRSQNFLTLVVLETRREWEGLEVTADDGTLDAVAQLISREVRDTDLLGKTDKGTLSLVLLDTDFDNSARVIDRLVSRIDSYEFPRRFASRSARRATRRTPWTPARSNNRRPHAPWRAGAADRRPPRAQHPVTEELEPCR